MGISLSGECGGGEPGRDSAGAAWTGSDGAGALLLPLPGSGGEDSKRHRCRCLQMFADVLLAPGVELVTSEPWLLCRPQLNPGRKLMLSFLLGPAPAWPRCGGQV